MRKCCRRFERGHEKDLNDVKHFFQAGLIEPRRVLQLFAEIEPQLYRYPNLDPNTFRNAVERCVRAFARENDLD